DVQPVHALSRNEATLLARELPNLRALLRPDPAAGPEAANPAHRALVRRVLRVVQGHPKLLELADAAARHPDRLAEQVAAAEAATADRAASLAAFFADGVTELDPDGFLDVLGGWTAHAVDELPEPTRALLRVLCWLEDDDRRSDVVEAIWPAVWSALGMPAPAPDLRAPLDDLASAALVHAETAARAAGPTRYRVQPGVADIVAGATPADVGTAVDAVLSGYWSSVIDAATPGDANERTGAVASAGLAAVPYLLRLRNWQRAGMLIEHAMLRDARPATVQVALPHLRRIAEATQAPEHSGLLARALRTTDPAAAERLLRDTLDRALAQAHYRAATAIAGDLANLLFDLGRLDQALDLTDRKRELTDRAGLGPWTQLADRALRLQIVLELGHAVDVLVEVDEMRGQMAAIPASSGADEF